MRLVRFLATAVIATFGLMATTVPAIAASYRGIGPYYTLNDVKAIFPQALVTFEKPAWAQPHQTLVKLTGVGIDGTVVLCMADYRDYDRLAEWQQLAKPYLGINHATDNNNALVVEWVRHVPEYSLPVQTLIAIHGGGYRQGYRKDNYRPYLRWDSKGIQVDLTTDSQWAISIEYNFTADEFRKRAQQLIENPKPPTYIPEPQDTDTEQPSDEEEEAEEYEEDETETPEDSGESGGDEQETISNVEPGFAIPRADGEEPSYGDISDKYVSDGNQYAWRKCIWDGSFWRIIKE